MFTGITLPWPWAYPALEVIHIIGIGLLLGNLVLLELRVFGRGAALPVPDLARLSLTLVAIGFSLATGVAQHEAPGGELPDDDGGVDEAGRFAAAVLLRDPEVPGCLGDPLILGPPRALTGGAAHPPADGFFADAAYLGAVRDIDDPWATAAWTRWD